MTAFQIATLALAIGGVLVQTLDTEEEKYSLSPRLSSK